MKETILQIPCQARSDLTALGQKKEKKNNLIFSRTHRFVFFLFFTSQIPLQFKMSLTVVVYFDLIFMRNQIK